MNTFQDAWVTAFATRDGLLLYHNLSGRTCRISREEAELLPDVPPEHPLHTRLVERGFMVDSGCQTSDFIHPRRAMVSRWAMFVMIPGHPPIIAERSLDEKTWKARKLRGLEATVWVNAQGQATVADLLSAIDEHAGAEGRDRAREILLDWTSGSKQLIKLIEDPIASYQEPPPHMFSLVYHYPVAKGWQPGEDVDLEAYHRDSIVDASDQFDHRETTLSHLLRYPSQVLKGRSFGEALIATLDPPHEAHCLEVGGGTGWLAQRVLEARPDLDYTIVDLSPALSAAQEKRLVEATCKATTRVGNALNLPIEDASIDQLINNEVVADLEAVRVDPEAAPALIQELGVVPESPRLMNVGALAFLKEVHRVLKPGGHAYMMEYGALNEEPIEARHLDHPEIGIEWGVMAQAATHLGFSKVEVVDIGTLLDFQDAPVLCLPAEPFEALNALLEAFDVPRLPKHAITMDELQSKLPFPLQAIPHLHFEPASERVMSFRPERMLALCLEK
jgi:SAM-dependent methyltransferase